ncbi:polyprenyl synthetase family protein [Carnobacterium maltaromaticum]|uniref:polyprenyl synthetase family protein n=1 Tax=Carnobacterium maltaromaticum TaxID=2751 RepID=UPI0012FA976C|nr:farnesyl diphosphate synthase [Carnobacterium maltaromaticum]
MDLNEFKSIALPQLEGTLIEELEIGVPTKGSLFEAMTYSVKAGGKRIRPLLLLATIQSLGGNIKSGLLAASALEYIHTYSLIHDDLPAMDDDALRRGQPTNHIIYGEALAILAGDGLLTLGFELLAKSPLTEKQKVRLILALSKAAGANGMVVGQVSDMEGESQKLTLTDLQNIHKKKTGELLKFAAYAGAVIVDADQETETQLVKFASHLGLAFQIRDDILDVIGTTAELGKETGMDVVHQKSTYPGLLTLAGAKKELAEELAKAQTSLANLDNKSVADTQLLEDFITLLEI